MADNNLGPKLAGLRNLQASLDQHRTKPAVSAACETRGRLGLRARRLLRSIGRAPVRSRVVWRIGIACAVVVALIPVALALLWWRLSYGPVPLDIATPWISAAIKENFGTRHRVDVGGTILERDQAGRTAVRIVDIVVRDPDGSVVASAPRAEVGISGASLLTGRPRAASLKLVGTELSVRIGADGQFTLLPAGVKTDAVAPSPASAAAAAAANSSDAQSKSFLSQGPKNFAATLAWIDSLQ